MSEYDLLICLRADLLRMSPYGAIEPLPESLPVIHLSERQWELGKNYATDIAVCADVKETLRALLDGLRAGSNQAYIDQAKERNAQLASMNWSVKRARKAEALRRLADQVPIHQDYLMLQISEVLPQNAILVEEALTSAPALASVLKSNDSRSYYGLASGGLSS